MTVLLLLSSTDHSKVWSLYIQVKAPPCRTSCGALGDGTFCTNCKYISCQSFWLIMRADRHILSTTNLRVRRTTNLMLSWDAFIPPLFQICLLWTLRTQLFVSSLDSIQNKNGGCNEYLANCVFLRRITWIGTFSHIMGILSSSWSR